MNVRYHHVFIEIARRDLGKSIFFFVGMETIFSRFSGEEFQYEAYHGRG